MRAGTRVRSATSRPFSEGEIVPIIGGARIVGRAGKWDMGFLDMQTTPFDYTDPDTDSVTHLYSTNHGVLRLRKQIFNETSYAGGMVTSKIDTKGNYNINTAADMILNPFKNNYITTPKTAAHRPCLTA